MLDGFHGQIHIQIGPIQMMRVRELHVQELAHRNISKPWKLRKGQKKFPPIKEQPETMLRDVGDFNFGSALAKLRGFHPHAP